MCLQDPECCTGSIIEKSKTFKIIKIGFGWLEATVDSKLSKLNPDGITCEKATINFTKLKLPIVPIPNKIPGIYPVPVTKNENH